MKFIAYNNGHIGICVTEHAYVEITDIAGVTPGAWPPVQMVQFISRFDELRNDLENRIKTGERKSLADIRLDSPVTWPNKVVAFPANYHAHIDEMKEGLISKFKASGQGFFLKSNSSLSGPADPIVLPPISGREIHHEAEMAIIIGKGGRGISKENALEHIFGYSCLLDIVVRGKEERVMRKSFDTFCPLGPWIVTRDEVRNPDALNLQLTVNGELRQQANTRDLIVDIPSMIEMASAVMTLEPGDVIATGTPAGVAKIVASDKLKITIESVGSMEINVRNGEIGDHAVWDKSAS